MKFGQLFLRDIFKIVATRCQILRQKCTKIEFDGALSQTPLEKLTDPLAGTKGKERREMQGGKGGKLREDTGGEARERGGREREGK